MTLQEAEFIANEFDKLTSVQSAEVLPNMDGYYSVLVTRTDGRRAVSCDLDTADGGLTVVKIEEDYAHAGYATLGKGNVPVFCSRETWKAWWEANPGGKVVKSEQSGGFVTEITFTGFSSERAGPLKFWTVDSHNRPACVTRSEASLPSKKRLRFSNRPKDQARSRVVLQL